MNIHRILRIIKIVTALTLVSASPLLAKATDEFVPEQLVCRVLPGYDISTINTEYGTTLVSYLSEISAYLLTTQPGQNADSLAAVISGEPSVVFCAPNYILDAPEAVQSSQPFLDQNVVADPRVQLAATDLQLSQAQTVSTGTGVKVAVIDVGVNLTHPMLAAVATSGFDFVANDSIANDEPGGISSGHGTFVAGVINLVAPDAQIISYRTLDTNGKGDGYAIAEALIEAVNAGCKVVNLSMVMNSRHPVLDDAIAYAHDRNVMVIAAAGNDSSEVDKFPADDSYTLSVAALDSTNVKADFSNYGGKVDVCAPGTQIHAPFLDTSYAWWDGTSFAAPFVAGQAALLYAMNPHATWNDIRDAIEQTAINIDSLNPGLQGKLGFGLINPVAAVGGFDPFLCGDIDGNGVGPDIADLVYLVDYMFNGGPAPTSPAASDVNGDGAQPDIGDLVYMVEYSFAGGPPPACGP